MTFDFFIVIIIENSRVHLIAYIIVRCSFDETKPLRHNNTRYRPPHFKH